MNLGRKSLGIRDSPIVPLTSHNPSTMSQQLAELKGTKLRSSAANDDVVEREFSRSLSPPVHFGPSPRSLSAAPLY